MATKTEIVKAVSELRDDVVFLESHHGSPAGAQHALGGGFNPSKALTNLSIIVGAIAPFIPAPVGPILTAIDEALGKLQVGGQAPQ